MSLNFWNRGWIEYYYKDGNLYFTLVDDSGSNKYKIRIYFKGDLEIEKVLFDDGQGNNKINDKNMMEDIKKQYLSGCL